MIPNLDKQDEIKHKRGNATALTRKAFRENDSLTLTSVALLWDELGEEKTAERCRQLAQAIAQQETLKNLVNSPKWDKPIIPYDLV